MAECQCQTEFLHVPSHPHLLGELSPFYIFTNALIVILWFDNIVWLVGVCWMLVSVELQNDFVGKFSNKTCMLYHHKNNHSWCNTGERNLWRVEVSILIYFMNTDHACCSGARALCANYISSGSIRQYKTRFFPANTSLASYFSFSFIEVRDFSRASVRSPSLQIYVLQ